MNTKLITLSLIASAAFACMGVAPAMAQNTPAVDNAQRMVHARIVQGTRSGHITRREADRLFAKEKQITRHEARFKSDGRITTAERQTLRNEIASLSSEVERKMSNRQTR
jgi:hypothetical protein